MLHSFLRGGGNVLLALCLFFGTVPLRSAGAAGSCCCSMQRECFCLLPGGGPHRLTCSLRSSSAPVGAMSASSASDLLAAPENLLAQLVIRLAPVARTAPPEAVAYLSVAPQPLTPPPRSARPA